MNNKLKSILKIIIIVCGIAGIGFLAIHYNKKSLNLEDTQELKDFDVTVVSYLNLMPGANPYGEAYFAFSLNGISKDMFLSEYEIESIELNSKKIRNQEITYEDYNGFRFYSLNYENNNTIVIIIKNKNTNKRYYKKLNVSTDKVY